MNSYISMRAKCLIFSLFVLLSVFDLGYGASIRTAGKPVVLKCPSTMHQKQLEEIIVSVGKADTKPKAEGINDELNKLKNQMLKDKGMVEQKKNHQLEVLGSKIGMNTAFLMAANNPGEALNMVVKSVAAFKRQATHAKTKLTTAQDSLDKVKEEFDSNPSVTMRSIKEAREADVQRSAERVDAVQIRLAESLAAEKALKDKCGGGAVTTEQCTKQLVDALNAIGEETRTHSVEFWKKENKEFEKAVTLSRKNANACLMNLNKQVATVDDAKTKLIQARQGELTTHAEKNRKC